MNQTKANAVSLHGDLMYKLTWKARKTDQKWLWGVILLISIAQLFVLPVLVTLFLFWSFHNTQYIFLVKMSDLTFIEVAVTTFLSGLLYDAILRKDVVFKKTSQFISVAGDMKRVMKSSTSRLGKAFALVGFAISGVLAVFCAYSIWIVRKKKLKSLSSTELDVLGNALSNGKIFWTQTRKIFDELCMRRAARNQGVGIPYQVAVSYGMACKWMLNDPQKSESQKKFLKTMIKDIMVEYPDLPEEVTMRYREVLG